jgi:hypothetical protein
LVAAPGALGVVACYVGLGACPVMAIRAVAEGRTRKRLSHKITSSVPMPCGLSGHRLRQTRLSNGLVLRIISSR